MLVCVLVMHLERAVAEGGKHGMQGLCIEKMVTCGRRGVRVQPWSPGAGLEQLPRFEWAGLTSFNELGLSRSVLYEPKQLRMLSLAQHGHKPTPSPQHHGLCSLCALHGDALNPVNICIMCNHCVQHTGEFLLARYKEVVETVLRFRDSKEKQIR